jgi:hypothetical protein
MGIEIKREVVALRKQVTEAPDTVGIRRSEARRTS